MADWTSLATDVLWRNGLSAIPLVGTAAFAAKLLPCRPATRHMMWLTVLAWFVIPPLLPAPPTPQLASFIERHVAAPAAVVPVAANVELHDQPQPDPSSTVRALIELSTALTREHSEAVSILPEPIPAARRATLARESTLPSPRLVARPADREPDLLAQASDAGGPLSLVPPAAAKAKPIGTEEATEKFEVQSAKFEEAPDRPVASNPSPERKRRVSPAVEPAPETTDDAGVISVELLPPFDTQASSTSMDLVVATTSAAIVGANYLWVQMVESMHGRAWAASLKAIRDDLLALPPIPVLVWASGVALFALVTIGRIWRFRRYIAAGTEPTAQVLRTVTTASRELGLSAPPRTLMIDGRLSPMIWCGLRPTLLIPAPLWSQLDEAGRRAVLFHELAHVRRRDHVVHWIESAIGVLYWWHPLVWWVRRCLHAEAEVCCDAWVTTLMPRRRRAYAEALLITQQYVDATDRPTPTLGIGVTTGRARRFARRLTMVMTESTKPRLSFSGFAMVLAMATVGWLATPASSCPDHEDKASTAKASATTKCPHAGGDCNCAKAGSVNATAPCAKVVGVAEAAPCAKAAGVAVVAPTPETKSTFEQHVAARHALATTPSTDATPAPVAVIALASGPGRHSRDDDDDDGGDDRVERLEQKMERLNEKLDRMMEAFGGRHGGEGHGGPMPPAPPSTPRAPRAAQAPQPPMPPMPPLPRIHSGPLPGGMGMHGDAEGGAPAWRTYRLPKEKLQALTNLMSRPDVPVLVRPGDEAIEVQATPGQHRIFGAFIRMIDPDNDSVSEGPGGHGPDRARMADAIREKVQREVRARGEGMGREARERAKELERGAKRQAKEMEKRERKRTKVGSRVDDIRSQFAQEMEKHETLEREAETLGEQAERLSEEADELRERNEELGERASREQDRESRKSLQREALALRHRAEQLDQEKEQIEDQARTIEDTARQAEDTARQAEDRVRQLEEELQQFEQEDSEEPDDDDDGGHASADGIDDAMIWQVIPADLPDADDDAAEEAIEAALENAGNDD